MSKIDEFEEKLKGDFVLFADVVFKTTLQLGPLTELQKDFCRTLVEEEADRLFLSCFRGFGKSYLLSIFCVWKLWNNRDEKIVVVSASSQRAKDFVRFCREVIKKTPLLSDLIDFNNKNGKKTKRTSVYSFDVKGGKTSQFASLKAIGISGQMTGARATVVVFDDVEISTNSFTEYSREKLADGMREANALLLPEGKIYIIGTPQSRFSIYNDLEGFKTIKYPIYYPDFNYTNLAPYLKSKRQKNGSLIGKITEHQRFTEKDIQSRKEAYGMSLFMLQYQLDTSESDLLRFPLQTKYLNVAECNPRKFCLEYNYTGNEIHKVYEYKKIVPSNRHWMDYHSIIIAVDTAGRGKDECASVVLATGGGKVFILDSYYNSDGHKDETFEEIINMAKRWGVTTIATEKNYAGGLYKELLVKHIMEHGGGIGVAEVISKGKKSKRIVETVEPFLTSNKLVADINWFKRETENPQYNMFQQAAAIDLDNIYTKYDDRIDALAIGLSYLQSNLALSEKTAKKEFNEKLWEEELNSVVHSHNWVKFGQTKHGQGNNFGNALGKNRGGGYNGGGENFGNALRRR